MSAAAKRLGTVLGRQFADAAGARWLGTGIVTSLDPLTVNVDGTDLPMRGAVRSYYRSLGDLVLVGVLRGEAAVNHVVLGKVKGPSLTVTATDTPVASERTVFLAHNGNQQASSYIDVPNVPGRITRNDKSVVAGVNLSHPISTARLNVYVVSPEAVGGAGFHSVHGATGNTEGTTLETEVSLGDFGTGPGYSAPIAGRWRLVVDEVPPTSGDDYLGHTINSWYLRFR